MREWHNWQSSCKSFVADSTLTTYATGVRVYGMVHGVKN